MNDQVDMSRTFTLKVDKSLVKEEDTGKHIIYLDANDGQVDTLLQFELVIHYNKTLIGQKK
jgi:hypothetical protein